MPEIYFSQKDIEGVKKDFNIYWEVFIESETMLKIALRLYPSNLSLTYSSAVSESSLVLAVLTRNKKHNKIVLETTTGLFREGHTSYFEFINIIQPVIQTAGWNFEIIPPQKWQL